MEMVQEDDSTGTEESQGKNKVEIEIDGLSAIAPTMLEVEILPIAVKDDSTQHQAGSKQYNGKIPVGCKKGKRETLKQETPKRENSEISQNLAIMYSFRCDMCHYKCQNKKALSLHYSKTHQRMLEHKCTLCKYSTERIGDLRRHLKCVHSKYKPFKCHVCDFESAERHRLQKHMKIHEKKHSLWGQQNRLSYDCNKCDRKFQSFHFLKRHKETDHKEEIM